MFSSVDGGRILPQQVNPAYWTRNMVQTVQFATALTECLQSIDQSPVCLEIGPHPALKGPSLETVRSHDVNLLDYLDTCSRDHSASKSVFGSIGGLLAVGASLDTEKINSTTETSATVQRPKLLTDLPPYPWDHSVPLWYETDVSKAVRYRNHPRHLLLGSRAVQDSDSAPCWRNRLRMYEVPFMEQYFVSSCGNHYSNVD